MTIASTDPKAKRKKRGQERPISGENDVGRERLLIAAESCALLIPGQRNYKSIGNCHGRISIYPNDSDAYMIDS